MSQISEFRMSQEDPHRRKRAKQTGNKKVTVNVNVAMKKSPGISANQWDLPAGFKPDGSFATLAEMVEPAVPTLRLTTLDQQSKHDLILERLKQQPDYPTISILGANKIDRQTAITEVENQTDIGKMIEEAEQNTLQILISRARTTE